MGSEEMYRLERVVEGENGVKIKQVVELAVSGFIFEIKV